MGDCHEKLPSGRTLPFACNTALMATAKVSMKVVGKKFRETLWSGCVGPSEFGGTTDGHFSTPHRLRGRRKPVGSLRARTTSAGARPPPLPLGLWGQLPFLTAKIQDPEIPFRLSLPKEFVGKSKDRGRPNGLSLSIVDEAAEDALQSARAEGRVRASHQFAGEMRRHHLIARDSGGLEHNAAPRGDIFRGSSAEKASRGLQGMPWAHPPPPCLQGQRPLRRPPHRRPATPPRLPRRLDVHLPPRQGRAWAENPAMLVPYDHPRRAHVGPPAPNAAPRPLRHLLDPEGIFIKRLRVRRGVPGLLLRPARGRPRRSLARRGDARHQGLHARGRGRGSLRAREGGGGAERQPPDAEPHPLLGGRGGARGP
mmetsp:Transcript_41049/g.95223  ORF Transcript_41049/g.95223 Transcript_41049/m.95223 type:complete len:368 (+) Transcript_41049:124-1227(+)